MKRITDFEWNDLVLYSKGWYESTANSEDEFFAEVERAIKMNKNRSYYSNMKKADILHFLFSAHQTVLNHLDESEKGCAFYGATPEKFFEQVKHWHEFYFPNDSWELAVAKFIISVFGNLTKDQIEIKRPFYKKGCWRIGNLLGPKYPISMTYKAMNKIADEYSWN